MIFLLNYLGSCYGEKQKPALACFLTLLGVLLIISGCNSQSSKSKSKPRANKTEHKTKTNKKSDPQKKTIVSELKDSKKNTLTYSPLGDSLSVGLLADTKTDRFTSQFARTLQKETGKTVKEAGASQIGKTATNFGLPVIQAIIDQDPDIVTVEFGTNDAADVNNPQALPKYRSSIKQILDQLQSQTHAKIILMTSWSPKDGPYVDNALRFDKVILDEGKSRHLPVVNLADIWQNDSQVTGSTSQESRNTWGGRHDNLHPNQLGHDKIAQALKKVINQKIK